MPPDISPNPKIRLQLGELLPAAPPAVPPACESPALREYRCRFVRAGRVKAAGGQDSHLEITAEALQSSAQAGKFNACAVFVDHAGFGEHPSLQRLVGSTGSSTWNPATGSVDGTIRLYATPAGQAMAQLLDQLVQEGSQAPDVGLSIVFWPRFAKREAGRDPADLRQIVEIRQVDSVDLVFQPAADGRILFPLSVLESESLAASTPNHPSFTQQGDTMKPEASPTQPTTSNVPGTPPESGGWDAAAARAASAAILAASGLPEPSRQRLAAGRFATPEALLAAIDGERRYLAALQESQVIHLPGPAPRSPQVSGMRTSLEQISLATEALLAGVRPQSGVAPLSGIRELYHLLSGDYEMAGVFQPERIQFSNVNSSTMAALVANALNKRLANEFQQYPRWWEKIVTTEDFTSLQQVRWITLGGLGELPTVAEGAAYTELTWDDKTETSDFTKKGGYLGITLESIDKDDTARLRAAPRALAQSAWLTLGKAVSSIFTASAGVGPTLSDSLPLFHADHGNLGSTALSVATYTAARTAMRKQTELHSGERLSALTAPRFLLVPPDLEITALQVLASQADYAYTLADGQAAPENIHAEGDSRSDRLNAARERVIVVDLWTDATDWAAVADPRLYPTIGLGFRYGRVPEIFSVASPTAGLMFSNDTMPIKARFFFAVGPMDWRGLFKANVAG